MDTVLELGDFAAGYCGRLFVNAGAAVVRIESANPAASWVSQTAIDASLHAGKRRLCTQDSQLIAQLAAKADVVICEAETNAALVALGFDDWAAGVKVAITPFGRTGPKRDWHATPATLLAMGGYTQIIGAAEQAPLTLPGHYLEFQSGALAYTAAAACLHEGVGNAVDIGMLETLMSLSQFTTVLWHCNNEIRARHGSDFWSVVPANMFACSDGWAYVVIVPPFWDAFALFLDRPELLVDDRFTNNDLRREHRDALHEIVAEIMAGFTKAEAVARAEEFRVPLGIVMRFEDVLQDHHLAQRNYWQQVSCAGQDVTAPGLPFRIDNEPRIELTVGQPEALAAPESVDELLGNVFSGGAQ